MDAGDPIADERTFRVDFTVDGAEKLRERVKENLREFMGEYTDDTLVEYIIVLLRNGRRQDEARKELNVFLGDDCVFFVSWLWDHLSTNLHLYVESKESLLDETAKTEPAGRRIIQLEHMRGSRQSDSGYDNERSTNVTRKQRNREWKGLVPEAAEQLSHLEGENGRGPQVNRKLRVQDEPLTRKRNRTFRPKMDAPRRLLQFAVRDAVMNVRQTSSKIEPALKRLNSVVSTSTRDSILDDGPGTGSVARGSVAAEVVNKVTFSSGVFDALGHVLDKQEASDIREPVLEGESNNFNLIQRENSLNYPRNDEYASDCASDHDGYVDVNACGHKGMDVSQSNKGSMMGQCSVVQDTDEVTRKRRIINQNPPATSEEASASRKIVNISVNVNTWKPPNYESPSIEVVGKQAGRESSGVDAGKPNIQLMQENYTFVSEKEKDVAHADDRKEVHNILTTTIGSCTTARPLDDVDSRTVFVSNVHFAADKNNLSRHFNKFGEVRKVIIVTDATTGQPKGSAYVEFLQKESTELALSLNGTSFMSRILKVVRKSSLHDSSSPIMRWPRAGRGSPSVRLGVPFPRGGVPMLRACLPVKPGSRSLQWKRGAPGTQSSDGAISLQKSSLSTITSRSSVLYPTGRNLTYIRKET